MASKKPVPLKDEQIYPADEILQHIEQLTVAVNNLANGQQTIIRDIEALSRTKGDSVSSEVRDVINNLLGKYLLDVKKVETDHDDTISVLKERYSTLAHQYSFAVDAFRYITNRCKHLTTEFSNVTKTLDALSQNTSELNQKLERLGMCVAASIGVLLGLLAFIAHDNAILRENQEKYILLQKSLRINNNRAV